MVLVSVYRLIPGIGPTLKDQFLEMVQTKYLQWKVEIFEYLQLEVEHYQGTEKSQKQVKLLEIKRQDYEYTNN